MKYCLISENNKNVGYKLGLINWDFSLEAIHDRKIDFYTFTLKINDASSINSEPFNY